MGELSDFAKKNSKFIKITDGESFTGVYQGYMMTLDKQGVKKPTYEFLIDGQVKYFTSASGFLANEFDSEKGKYKKGQRVKIVRIGNPPSVLYQTELIINDSDLGATEEAPF